MKADSEHEPCPDCGGSGKIYDTNTFTCPTCHGSGCVVDGDGKMVFAGDEEVVVGSQHGPINLPDVPPPADLPVRKEDRDLAWLWVVSALGFVGIMIWLALR